MYNLSVELRRFPSPFEVTGVSYYVTSDEAGSFCMFPSPLEVTGGSYLTEYGITLESVRFPYPLEVIRGYYQAKHKQGGHQMTVFVSSRGN